MKSIGFIDLFKIKWLLVVTFISVTWVNFNQEKWKNKDVIQHDIINYYSYLPALFYERDLSLSFLNDTLNKQAEGAHYWPNKTPEGNHVIKMSMGMAVTYFPFFCLAHIYAKIFDYDIDGFSQPYHFAVLFSTLFYFLIGLLYAWKILRLHFSESLSFLTLFFICFGTNVFFYLTIAGGLSHTIGFTIIALFIYYTILWHQKLSWKYSILLGALFGLAVLVRPINGLVLLFLLLYNVKSFKDIRLKINFFLSNLSKFCMVLFVSFLIFSPQLIYWKYVTGHYVFNSYVGEHFFFQNPHVLSGLFSFRKGWLVYTPIMVFSLIGIFFLRHDLKKYKTSVVLFFCCYVYVAFSWWCWWYGGSFGQRVLIDIYPLLAIPFAAFLLKIQAIKPLHMKITYSTLFALVLLNLFQTMQIKYNIIHYDSMTRANYFEIFLTTTKKADREKYLQHPDYEKARKGIDEY